MNPVKRWALQDIRTVRTHMHFSGRSRVAFAIWAPFPAAITALLLPSMILPLWSALQTPQPACTHFPGLLPKVCKTLERCPVPMPVQLLPSTIKARSWEVPAIMRLCGRAAAFKIWAHWAAQPVRRTASIILVQSSASLIPARFFMAKGSNAGPWPPFRRYQQPRRPH
jgi:hypothetical protein